MFWLNKPGFTGRTTNTHYESQIKCYEGFCRVNMLTSVTILQNSGWKRVEESKVPPFVLDWFGIKRDDQISTNTLAENKEVIEELNTWDMESLSVKNKNIRGGFALCQCITGNKDNFAESVRDKEMDYFLFTDNPKGYKSSFYKILEIPDGDFNKDIINCLDSFGFIGSERNRAYNLLISQKIRILAPVITELRNYDYVVWMDSNMKFVRSPLEWVMNIIKSNNSLLYIYEHPVNNCIFKEIKLWNDIKKYFPKSREKTMNFYNSIEFPKNYGLHGGGINIKNMKGGIIYEYLRLWWQHVLDITISDQLSLPYIRHHHGFPVKSIGRQFDSEFKKYITIGSHRS